LPEISSNTTEQQSIPIYGHNDYKEKEIQKEQPQNKRSKRIFDQNNQSAAQQMNQEDNGITEQPLNELEESEACDEDAASNSISEAGEVENETYKIPPLTILKQPAKQKSTTKAEVQKKGQLLENTLKNFGVDDKVTQIKIGPAVTQYEIQPAKGVKVSKIVNLHNGIALALAAKDIRIEAPIPGRSAVGIEVPNDKISLVSLKEVLDEKFPASNKLEVGLGRDIS